MKNNYSLKDEVKAPKSDTCVRYYDEKEIGELKSLIASDEDYFYQWVFNKSGKVISYSKVYKKEDCLMTHIEIDYQYGNGLIKSYYEYIQNDSTDFGIELSQDYAVLLTDMDTLVVYSYDKYFRYDKSKEIIDELGIFKNNPTQNQKDESSAIHSVITDELCENMDKVNKFSDSDKNDYDEIFSRLKSGGYKVCKDLVETYDYKKLITRELSNLKATNSHFSIVSKTQSCLSKCEFLFF